MAESENKGFWGRQQQQAIDDINNQNNQLANDAAFFHFTDEPYPEYIPDIE